MIEQPIKWHQSKAATYACCGAFFGLFFPIIGTAVDLFRLDLGLSWANIAFVQGTFPIHLIIDTAPIFLGVFAAFAGWKQDMLIRKNQALVQNANFKSQFLSNMSHEIRTPMNGVIGMIDVLLNNTNLDNTQQEYVETIHRSSQDLLAILNDILDLSKLEAGQMEIKHRVMNIHGVVHKVKGLFAAKAKQKGLTIHSVYAPDLPDCFKASDIRLTQIISNLVGNAVKFTDQGDITIKSSLMSVRDGQQMIKVEVIDTGQGISTENQKRLFKQFQQLDQSLNKSIKGTGLGLAICKKLVELMGGELGVSSAEGKGSNFWFTFLAIPVSESERLSIKKEKKEIVDAKFDLNVLVVDDNDVNIMLTELMLINLGCRVESAQNGKMAVEKSESRDYDLILMDIQMPIMNGVEATQTIKKLNKKTPPIIGLSANAMEGDAEKYMAQGLDDYLVKPITQDALRSKLAVWFKARELEKVT